MSTGLKKGERLSAGIRYTVHPTHISLIRAGDVVEHWGELRTVGRNDLKRSAFFGATLWGDCCRCGNVLVLKAEVFHARPTNTATGEQT